MNDFENKKLIIHYLEKSYYVKENLFFDKTNDYQIWGNEIIESLISVLSYGFGSCKANFYIWATEINGLTDKEFRRAFEPVRLRTSWNPETPQALARLGVENPEKAIIDLISDNLAVELSMPIFNELKNEFKTGYELLSFIKCIGYASSGPSFYDVIDFTPRKQFEAITYNEMMYERENNSIWQNMVRTREQNQEAYRAIFMEENGHGSY